MHENSLQRLVERDLVKRAQVRQRLTDTQSANDTPPWCWMPAKCSPDPVQAHADYVRMDRALSAFYG